MKGVIFDLDGVIVSTDTFHYQAWKRIADEESIYFNEEINNRLRGVSRMESLEIILEKSDRLYSGEEKQELAHRKNEYYIKSLDAISPKDILPGVLNVIRELKARGIKIAIGSSSRNAAYILKKIGMETLFDAVASGNDITHSKPHPQIFLIAAERLSLSPSDCIVVEDAISGIDAANSAGMISIAIGDASGCRQANYSLNLIEDLFSAFNPQS